MLKIALVLSLLTVLAVRETNASRKYKLVCYYSSWATYRYGHGTFTSSDIDPQLCTHVIYAFAGLDANFNIRILDPWLSLEDGGGKGDFSKFIGLRSDNPSLKLLIGVGGWNEGSPRYSQMAAVPKNRKAFIDSSVQLIRDYGFDGLNLDWQYPANRGGLSSDKRNFPILLKELREAFAAEKLTLGISAAANKEIIDAGYDVAEITKHVDYISLLSYDYHGAWETRTGMNSPLYARKGASTQEKNLNQDASVKIWLNKGAEASKLLLGLATYGRTFMLRDATKNRVGDASFRPGNPGTVTQQDGFLGYNEIMDKFTESDGWVVNFDDEAKVPYAYNGELWISYDNERSFGLKADYVKQQGLGGAMVWSLDTDDFTGISGRANPLVQTLVDVLEDGRRPPTDSPVTGRPPTARPSTPKPSKLECKTFGSFQHPEDCTKFYVCISSPNGLTPVVNSCPPNLAFDNVTKACNWMDAVPECNK